MKIKLLTPFIALAVFAGSASATIIFTEDFESPATDNFTTSAPSGWVKGTAGPFGAGRSGTWDSSYAVGDGSTYLEGGNSSLETGASYVTSDGSQAYLLTTYNGNNGLTTAEDSIGTASLGDYTLSFLLGVPTNITDGQYNDLSGDVTVTIFAMDGVADGDRNNVTTTPTGATVLFSTVISSTAHTLESKTYDFTLDNSAYAAQDLAIRFQADSYDFPLLDAVSLDYVAAVPEPSTISLLAGCFGLTWIMVRRRG